MRIAINGVGVAGPTLAYWLRAFGHEPVLFERHPELRRGGYVIDFWGLGYEIAERMGLIAALRERSYEMQRMRMVDARGREEASVDVAPMRELLGGRFFSIARADLAAALFGACDGIPTHFGVSVTGVAQDGGGVAVELSDGRRERFDLLVGADGLHSRVREIVFGPEERFEQFLDCYVAAVRVRGYPHRDELTYVSHTVARRHVGRVTLRNDETLILFVCRAELVGDSPARDGQKAAIRRAFADAEWEVPEMLDLIDDADDFYFDRVSQAHVPCWYSDRVALVGDAAACPSLLAGEGTGLAMAEAYVLAGELHRARGDVARGLAAYDARLHAFVTAKQKAALRLRGFFAPNGAVGLMLRSLAIRALGIPVLEKRLLAGTLRDELSLPTYAAE